VGELDTTVLYLFVRARLDGTARIEICSPTRGRRLYQKTGLFRLITAWICPRSILEQHPWVTINLATKHFAEARDLVMRIGIAFDDVCFNLSAACCRRTSASAIRGSVPGVWH